VKLEDEATAILNLFEEAKSLGDTRGYLIALERAIEFRRRAQACVSELSVVENHVRPNLRARGCPGKTNGGCPWSWCDECRRGCSVESPCLNVDGCANCRTFPSGSGG
jgi:hypothetical protein